MGGYVGNQPNFQNFAQDLFNGGAGPYTLTYTPGSVFAILVFVDGVRQYPTTDYTVSSNVLTPVSPFPAGTNNVAVIYLGIRGDVATPANATITTAMLIDANVTGAKLSLSQISNVLGADVALNNTGLYFDGPSVAQGATGIWYASGTVTLTDTAGAATFIAKLHDGTNIASVTRQQSLGATARTSLSLSGFFTSPPGNIRISVNDPDSTSGKILFNNSGLSKDSTVFAFRIG